MDNLLPAAWGAIEHGFQHFSLGGRLGDKGILSIIRRVLTRGTGDGEKILCQGEGIALVDPI